jgi:AbiU2
MPTKEELKENIWSIWKILILAKECHQFSFYLYQPKTSEEAAYINNSRHLQFIRHILWRNTAIELSKLFNKSQRRDKFNIFHFINKLRHDQYFGQFKINPKKISEWENKLESNKHNIDLILKLRDKVYGHTDLKEPNKELDIPTFEETKILIEIVESIIQEIFSTAFDSHATMETPIFDRNRFNMIKVLAEEKENRMGKSIEEFIKNANKNK